jgi:hypothetical protein
VNPSQQWSSTKQVDDIMYKLLLAEREETAREENNKADLGRRSNTQSPTIRAKEKETVDSQTTNNTM